MCVFNKLTIFFFFNLAVRTCMARLCPSSRFAKRLFTAVLPPRVQHGNINLIQTEAPTLALTLQLENGAGRR